MSQLSLRATAGAAAGVALLFVEILNPPWLHAQPRSASPTRGPAFEVASVKPNKSGASGGSSTFLPGGRYVGANVTLRRVVGLAYLPLLGIQIIGGPAWINSEPFDIEAKAEGNPSADELRLMLRTLLADRFTLRVHSEKRESPVYALVMARSDGKVGARLQRSAIECGAERGNASPAPQAGPPSRTSAPDCRFRVGTRNFGDGTPVQLILDGKGITMTQLAAEVSAMAPVGRLVFDQTGLTGRFDVNLLQWSSDTSRTDASTSDVPSFFTALQEQLGLKLQSTTGPVDVLVIDHAEHPAPD